ncbi:Uncharacterised protein [Klebsiella pneumoniae]|nr:Uncharacterised protein [Klebsiella pneumoniae]SVN24897.1 Uncharacterised protein [Klebsiella pneumoniae]SVR34429.1 Uncharacterised protein [Klebsiella pneumoniae]SVW81989.1 Uncharacterised protein [Klebsiella pneumoniae]SWU84565.1 Uncharacterised protein [Klebsiella pneumoniae]
MYAGLTLDECVEAFQLTVCGFFLRFVRTAEVTHDVDWLHYVAAVAQPLIEFLSQVWTDAQSMHAGIQLHPHRNGVGQNGLFKCEKLFNIMHDGFKVILGQQRKLVFG